jgi:UDP-N-acetylglucosamine pyrophosphorylase
MIYLSKIMKHKVSKTWTQMKRNQKHRRTAKTEHLIRKKKKKKKKKKKPQLDFYRTRKKFLIHSKNMPFNWLWTQIPEMWTNTIYKNEFAAQKNQREPHPPPPGVKI